jgi:hypothetical protein
MTATDEACRIAAGVMRRRKRETLTCSDAVPPADRNGLSSSDRDGSKRIPKGMASAAGEGGDGYSSDDGFIMEEKIIAEAALSARGVWAYTVGLVGKPSAGTAGREAWCDLGAGTFSIRQ